MSRYYHHVTPCNPDTLDIIMTRSNNSRGKQEENLDYTGFTTTSQDAQFIRERLVEEPWRFLPNPDHVSRPAGVVDKLRKAYARLVMYNRDSMKNRVRRIMNEDDTKRTIVKKFANRNKPAGAEEEEEDDQLVSCNGSDSQIDRRYFDFNNSFIFQPISLLI